MRDKVKVLPNSLIPTSTRQIDKPKSTPIKSKLPGNKMNSYTVVDVNFHLNDKHAGLMNSPTYLC